MLVIINKYHVQGDLVAEGQTNYFKNKDDYVFLDDITEAVEFIDEQIADTKEVIIFAGFIYKDEEIPEWLKSRGNVYFVTDIGKLPVHLKMVSNEHRHYSLNHQLVEVLTREGYNIPETFEEKVYKETDYFNFIRDTGKKLVFVDKNILDNLKGKCYNKGIVYVVYENNPKYKIALAHHILDELDKGMVVIGSQTKTDNDILTFYCKGLNTSKIAKTFGVEHTSESNIFTTFIPSQISVLGNNILKFIQERK